VYKFIDFHAYLNCSVILHCNTSIYLHIADLCNRVSSLRFWIFSFDSATGIQLSGELKSVDLPIELSTASAPPQSLVLCTFSGLMLFSLMGLKGRSELLNP
jgi:hypothetical protein